MSNLYDDPVARGTYKSHSAADLPNVPERYTRYAKLPEWDITDHSRQYATNQAVQMFKRAQQPQVPVTTNLAGVLSAISAFRFR